METEMQKQHTVLPQVPDLREADRKGLKFVPPVSDNK